jgi:hypothetical protein
MFTKNLTIERRLEAELAAMLRHSGDLDRESEVRIEEFGDSGAYRSRCVRALLFPAVTKFDEPSLRRVLSRVGRHERAGERWGGGMQDKDRAAVLTPTACLHIEKTAALV